MEDLIKFKDAQIEALQAKLKEAQEILKEVLKGLEEEKNNLK